MILTYYSVEDAKAEQFGPLFPARNLDVAKRMFKSLMREVDPEYYSDYFLHSIGVFDDETGIFKNTRTEEDPFLCAAIFLEDN